MTDRYKQAGVDVHAGYQAVELMRDHVKSTNVEGVLSSIGGFGGLFSLDGFSGMAHPTLVSGTDGVGTKLKLAFLMDKHTTVGQDCVAMCVNDIICSGAQPLFFLDYIALGKNVPEKVAQIVQGVARGCVAAGCALIGGETAEMPGFYPIDEYDLAGFCVGIVDRENIIDGKADIEPGDALIGIASSGVHSNGFSLVRHIFDMEPSVLNQHHDELGSTLGEALLCPTKIYVKALLKLIDQVGIHGASHITGGGFYENIPRMLPENCKAVIDTQSYPLPPLFSLIQQTGQVSRQDMYGTFNMGMGMVVAVDAARATSALQALQQAGETAYIIGRVEPGEGIELL